MARVWLFFFLADIVLTAAALISCLSTEDEDIRALPRIVWVLIILFFSPIGAIVWFFAGRERIPVRRGQTWRMGGGLPESERPRRTVAPDDDPDFLKHLERSRAEQAAAEGAEAEREMLRKWEEDLRRREDELRKRDKPEE
jgi:hypothetical protein